MRSYKATGRECRYQFALFYKTQTSSMQFPPMINLPLYILKMTCHGGTILQEFWYTDELKTFKFTYYLFMQPESVHW